ncbi:MAG TPA: ATP-binding protein [Thermoanaerobaculia bacterium]|nr:ATP-binding protein [Thermoanaerobaculia bacterium]
MPIRITITGPESTGKSTLAADLAQHYDCVLVPEFSRHYASEKLSPLDAGDVNAIAAGQMESEDGAAKGAGKLTILDTDLLSTVVYSHHYYNACPQWIEKEAIRRAADLYLLMAIDVPWIADPQRDRGDRREEMFALFEERLESLQLPYATIAGDWPQRRHAAMDAIQRILDRGRT